MRSSLSPQPVATIALAVSAAPGASRFNLTTTALVPAGTMITVGAQNGTQQLVMVLQDIQPGGMQSVEIAPRLRSARAAGVPIAAGAAAAGLFRLLSDDQGRVAIRAGRGVAAVSFIEHVT
jgi:hypothetical protein